MTVIRFPLDSLGDFIISHRDVLGHVFTSHFVESTKGVRNLSRLECSCGDQFDVHIAEQP